MFSGNRNSAEGVTTHSYTRGSAENIISTQKKQKKQYDTKHSKAVFYSVGTQVLKKDFRKKKKEKEVN